MREGSFNLKQFFRELQIPEADQDPVRECLMHGVQRHVRHLYGYDRHGEDAAWLISERMHEPYIFGFAAVEIVRHPTLPLETRFTIIRYTLEHMRPLVEHGTPHGLPAITSFLAAVGALDAPRFRTLIQIAEVEGRLFDDWLFHEAQSLLDWLIVKADIPDDERLWWLWHISVHCEQPNVGKPLIEHLLNHSVLPVNIKRGLCWAWMDDKTPGSPPEQWTAIEAMMQGDSSGLEKLSAETTLPIPVDANDPESGSEPFVPSFGYIRTLLASQLGVSVLTPPYFKRRALVALAQFGENPLTLARTYLGASRNFDADAVNQGVADLLREHRASLPEDATRELVEKGMSISSVPTRKAFYQLAADLFGPGCWERAAKDNAASIRKWAAEKASGSESGRKRGRPKRRNDDE